MACRNARESFVARGGAMDRSGRMVGLYPNAVMYV